MLLGLPVWPQWLGKHFRVPLPLGGWPGGRRCGAPACAGHVGDISGDTDICGSTEAFPLKGLEGRAGITCVELHDPGFLCARNAAMETCCPQAHRVACGVLPTRDAAARHG